MFMRCMEVQGSLPCSLQSPRKLLLPDPADKRLSFAGDELRRGGGELTGTRSRQSAAAKKSSETPAMVPPKASLDSSIVGRGQRAASMRSAQGGNSPMSLPKVWSNWSRGTEVAMVVAE